MKIVFHGYNTCCQNQSGGVQVRIRKIHDLLQEKGIQVDFFSPFDTHLGDYDILHLFGLNYETNALISSAKSMGLHIIISTIVIPQKDRIRDKIRRRLLNNIHYYATIENLVRNNVSLAEKLIVETPYEQRYICNTYNRCSEDVIILPNGINDIPKDVGDNNPLGDGTKYVMQVGRFDENKNQINVIRALRDTGIHCVFIGGPGASNKEIEYYNMCLEEAKDYSNFHFVGWLNNDSDMLYSYYRHADTLIVPSYYETFGMIVLEGGVFGCKLLLSDRIPIREFDSLSKCRTIDPSSIDEIRYT